MTRDLEFARAMLTVAKAGLANRLVDHEPDHPRVKDARENVAGWAREVERLERMEEDARFASLTAGGSLLPLEDAAASSGRSPDFARSGTPGLGSTRPPAVSDAPAEEGGA